MLDFKLKPALVKSTIFELYINASYSSSVKFVVFNSKLSKYAIPEIVFSCVPSSNFIFKFFDAWLVLKIISNVDQFLSATLFELIPNFS